ncbi:MAG: DUF262 domain-containing protein [Desulfovibrionales bacterium]|nr:DUF262 domain-containing protein [Desulfovibrionales bacterium]
MSNFKPRGYSVNDFLSWNERNELVLQPKFQRREVWSAKAKSHLIDTILRDLPIPIIFVRQNVDPKQRRTIREVVDGQQRLRAIISFANDEFAILKSQNPSLGGKTFSQLPSESQQRLLDYELSVVLLQGISDAEVLDIFARLNTYAQKLTSQELLNAAYYGEFKQTVYSLGYAHLEFWRQNAILQDRQIMRMGEAELTTELLVVMLVGVQHRRNKIKTLYESKDDSFPEKERVVKEFKAVIDTIMNCLGDSLKNMIFSRRVLFYSLFCAFYHVMYGIPDTVKLGQGGNHPRFSTSELLRVKDSLMALSSKYKGPSPSREIENFIAASQKATGDREQRITRIAIIAEYINKAIDSGS